MRGTEKEREGEGERERERARNQEVASVLPPNKNVDVSLKVKKIQVKLLIFCQTNSPLFVAE